MIKAIDALKEWNTIPHHVLSFISELFEISHIRTIYHMFIAVLLIFCLSTLTVDYIDQGRSVCVCVRGLCLEYVIKLKENTIISYF